MESCHVIRNVLTLYDLGRMTAYKTKGTHLRRDLWWCESWKGMKIIDAHLSKA